MKLIVAGCSHTAGCEITSWRDSGNPDKAWGAKVAEKFGWELQRTIAGPAWGNDWIFDNVFEYFEKLSDRDEEEFQLVNPGTPEDHFCIIGWTCPGRYSLYCHESDQVLHACPGQDPSNFAAPAIYRRVDQHYKTAMPGHLQWRHEHFLILAMQDFLKKIGVRYLFFDAVTANHAAGDLEFNLKHIDEQRYFRLNDEQNSYWNNWLQNNWDGTPRWSQHAPESYHETWAELLCDHIEKENLAE